MLDYKELLAEQPHLWELYSRKEEYCATQLDKHGRFTFAASKHNGIEDASVSRFLFSKGIVPQYPNGKKFAICLTHDVDDIYPPLIHTLASSVTCIKKFNIKDLVSQWSQQISKNKKSPYRNFDQIMHLEDKYNAKSTFYFMATERDLKRVYNIKDIEDDLKAIINNGWDIGLHTGYYSYDNVEEIIQEKQRLEDMIGQQVMGCRNHYLRFNTPTTWELLARAGFKYDTTYGYPDAVGFRNGTCWPFKPYGLNNSSQIDIMEIPLNMMDGTLFGYMNLDLHQAKEKTIKLIDVVRELHGVLTVLWHNSIFNWPYRQQWAELYEWLLQYASEKDAWLTSTDEIFRWLCTSNMILSNEQQEYM